MMIDNSNNLLISPQLNSIPRFDPKIRLAVLASGKGTNFEALIRATDNLLDANIVCLIVNKEKCGAIKIAKKYKIPYILVDHKSFGTREELDRELIKILSNYKVELVVMAGWMRVVTKVLIENYKHRIVNIHPSLLPAFKGSNSISDCINSTVKIAGCTVHLVEEEVDSGEILIQGALPVNQSDNEEKLITKIQLIEHKLLYKGVAIAAHKLRT